MYWADTFMHEYGMSFNDFLSLKIPTFFALIEQMGKAERFGWDIAVKRFLTKKK